MANKQVLNENPGYSTLEVHNNEDWTHMRQETQVVYDSETLPELAPKLEPTPPVEDEERRILGVKKRSFILIVCLVFMLIIGAAVGVGVGVTRNRGGATAEPEDSSTSTDQESVPYDSPVLITSNLAAVNWTDNIGKHYCAVFWQARETGSLMMSIKNPARADWEVVDIGKAAEDAVPRNLRFDAQNGTSIAAVAYGAANPDGSGYGVFRLVVAYTNSNGFLCAIGCGHLDGREWWFEDLMFLRYPPLVSSGSQLTAWWPRYDGSEASGDNAYFFFEDQENQLSMIRRRTWNSGSTQIGTASLQPGSGLVVAPVSRDWNLDKMMVLYDQSGSLVHRVLDAASGFGANDTNNPNVLMVQDGLPSPPPKLTALSFIPQGLSVPEDSLAVMRYPNGTILVNYWNEAKSGMFPDQKWSGASAPRMQGMNITNFTSIAMPGLDNLRFFGLTPDGLIHSYTIDRQDPFTWTYEELVNTEIS